VRNSLSFISRFPFPKVDQQNLDEFTVIVTEMGGPYASPLR
jgi:hypothetical protein